MSLLQNIRSSLETGFIDKQHQSMSEYQPKLILNNKLLNKKILHTILYELNTCEEFYFSVAFLTKSGVAVLINTLDELREKGIKGKVLVSQYLNFTEPEALKTLMKLDNIELRIVTNGDFHAKGYFFKHSEHYSVIVGSSNLTSPALTKSKEWNLMVSAHGSSKIIEDSLAAFDSEFAAATTVNDEFIERYQLIFNSHKRLYIANNEQLDELYVRAVTPNLMQVEALENLAALRKGSFSEKGPQDKALLISATGTGKTYLSTFDVQMFNPRRMLFIVHRANIAKAALASYKNVFKDTKKMGLFYGGGKDIDSDFLFSTIQTLSRDNNLNLFAPDEFDYIVIDETHRAGATTYQKILSHFKPKFLLGMTATPERTDGYDIFKFFDYNIAYEIRLHRALDEDMLCPFHYYGVTDIYVDDDIIDDDKGFLVLTSEERVNQIIKKSELYGTDDGSVRGLVFCNSNAVSAELSRKFNSRGYKTVALSGESSENEREEAINRLEEDDVTKKLDYIFTVDIFNEGIDIPRVNQIVMLRPTQSAIIFVQQLGRGLRKIDGKDYLTVIDFIGNYKSSYLIPVALYGDSSYNKDKIRKLISGGSNTIPGTSTINFDKITRDQIFKAIDSANMQMKRDLVKDYNLLKFKLGRVPMMMDFIRHGSRDPKLFADYSKSYFNFVMDREGAYRGLLSPYEMKLLELLGTNIANGKRIEEVIALRALLGDPVLDFESFSALLAAKFDATLTNEIFISVYRNLNMLFVTDKDKNKLVSAGIKYNVQVIDLHQEDKLMLSVKLAQSLRNKTFMDFFVDMLAYAEYIYDSEFNADKYVDGFILYKKYSRKDVFRILCWDENPVAQNVGGYIVSKDKTNCPVFVNYHKEADISNTTKYEDEFINNHVFQWMSKSKRTLESPDVQAIRNHEQGLRMPLFIKKHNDEGTEFYYMGDVKPIDDSFEQMTMPDDKGNSVSVVKINFKMLQPVDNDIYEYITAVPKEF